MAGACRGDFRDHLKWGDRLQGTGRTGAALAEYQVALRVRGPEPEILLRLAHGYAKLDRLEEAVEFYARLLTADSSYADQAIADLVQMARRALARGDVPKMARLLEQVQAIRPGAVPEDLVRPLAEHYHRLGDHQRALPFLLVAQTEAEAPAAERSSLWYALARTYEALGDCRAALEYFQQYLSGGRARGARRTPGVGGARGEQAREARWYAGGCAYRLAEEARALGRPAEALQHLDLVIGYGMPRAVLDEAWFHRGEILYGLGRYEEALLAYQKVLELNPSRTGRLVWQAEDRIRAIRFRR